MPTSRALHTDFYQITMSAIYHAREMEGQATFSLFPHRLPDTRNFIVTAGQEQALDYLENFYFTDEDIAYLDSLGRFDKNFLERMAKIRFSGEVWAMPEGSISFATEPILEITAPLMEAQLVETILMNTINLHSTLASKAARCRIAAKGKSLLEFGLRRTQGLEAGLAAARSSAIVGFLGTSNVAAAKRFDILPVGTMAHSFITAFDNELEAFRAFAKTFPEQTILLVDTFNTEIGIKRAIEISYELKKQGYVLQGIRLDSGNLAELSKMSRQMLDEAGLKDTKVVVSGNLEEHSIRDLFTQQAPVDTFAVGTRMSSSSDAPVLDLAYKMVSYNNRPTSKLSTGKETLPSPKQVWRTFDGQGKMVSDLIGCRDEKQAGEPLLQKIMSGGKRLNPKGTWREARKVFEQGLQSLPEASLNFEKVYRVPVTISQNLQALQNSVRKNLLA